MQLNMVVVALIALSACAALISTASGQPPTVEAAKNVDCPHDRSALLALEYRAFDQDLNGGWRALAQREACMEIAADLIRDYREIHTGSARMLYWHEGQLRAMLGATSAAIALFEKSYNLEDSPTSQAWNLYVDASLAFLRRDKSSLLDAREALAAQPRPEGIAASADWPMNLNIVDMLIACFDSEYNQAYGQCNP